jgi:hypothetical protein
MAETRFALCSQVDTIDWCRKRLGELGPELAEEQHKTVTERTIDAALVFFNSRAIATMSAQVRRPSCIPSFCSVNWLSV